MARTTTHSQHPSSARRRRELHIERDAKQKASARTRRTRAEIHAAMAEATKLVSLSKIPTAVAGEVKATDKKVAGKGWLIVSGPIDSGLAVFYEGSRDKARARARDHNSGIDPILLGGETITHDQAMLQLGWTRVERDGAGRHVEEKFVRTTSEATS